MNDDTTARLRRAIDRREPVRITYAGGSQPNTARHIVPMRVRGDEVEAEDIAARELKTFKIDKIRLLTESDDAVEYDPSPDAAIAPTVAKAIESEVQGLRLLGWHVEVADDAVGLCRYFKNGKARKTPDIVLSYDEWTVDFFDDFHGKGMQELRRPSTRPYAVRTRSAATRTFASQRKAVVLFLNEARRLAPNIAT